MSKISELSDGGNIQNGDVLIAVRAGGNVKVSYPITATTTELNYVDGVTSPIQTQLNAKAPSDNPSFTGDADFDSGTFFVDASMNNVGIGTSSPSAKLDVNGSIKASDLYLSGGVDSRPSANVSSTQIGYSILTTSSEGTAAETEFESGKNIASISVPVGTWVITGTLQVINSSGFFSSKVLSLAITTDSSFNFPVATNAGFRPEYSVYTTENNLTLVEANKKGRVSHTRIIQNFTGSSVTYYFRAEMDAGNTGIYGHKVRMEAVKVL